MPRAAPAFSWPTATIPRIRGAGRFPLNDRGYSTTYLGRTHALHLHLYAGRIRIGDASFDLHEGDLTLSPAGVASGYDLPTHGYHWCVHFYPQHEHSDRRLDLPLHMPLQGSAMYVRERLMHISRLHARGEANDALSATAAALALKELLLWCAAREQAGGTPNAAAVVDKVAAIVDARVHELPSMQRIAREVGRSQNYIARSFKERFGMTILQYALSRRIAQARYLLEATDLPIWEVAERVGIADAQYFNKQIRRRLGDSPTAIRAAARTGGWSGSEAP